jgi:hypothetical protein
METWTVRSRFPMALAAAMASALLLAGCASNSDSKSTTGSDSGGTGGGSAGSGASPGTTGGSSRPKVKDIIVSVKDGKVTPALDRVKVDKGMTVKILVNSDKEDEVHVHGYEKESAVSPTVPAIIVFTADKTGEFEVETHKSSKVLFLLQVS